MIIGCIGGLLAKPFDVFGLVESVNLSEEIFNDTVELFEHKGVSLDYGALYVSRDVAPNAFKILHNYYVRGGKGYIGFMVRPWPAGSWLIMSDGSEMPKGYDRRLVQLMVEEEMEKLLKPKPKSGGVARTRSLF
jgi:hypothetical protein